MDVLDLGGNWHVQSGDGKISFEGNVPGSLFGDLENQGHFGEQGISWRENNRDCLAVADQEFRWTRDFIIDSTFLPDAEEGSVWLEADGLDTLADIFINGNFLAATRNMHRRYRFCLDGLLNKGKNHLEIRFANALEYCRQEHQRRPLWHSYQDTPEIAFTGFNTIRKSHCSFGWDWGPIVPDVGIWRAIRIVRYDVARIADLQVLQNHFISDGKPVVELKIAAQLEYLVDGVYAAKPKTPGLLSKLKEALSEGFGEGGQVTPRGILHLPDGSRREFAMAADGSALILIKNPELWWPNGLGQQALYGLQIDLLHGRRVIHSRTLQIGLRKLEVRREPDQWGESFEFVVNGLPIFARGADFIPQDISLPRVSRQKTERLIQDAVAAHFNCLRVWGGGVYPSDDFFELCDQYGLVVWQDLMFACALYDIRNDEFVDNILQEVKDNLRRIRHHASLGLICGNNEMEVAMVEWGLPNVPETRTEYLLQYQYHFKRLVAQECPETFYWPASPSSGGDFNDPNKADTGDCHFWTVWHGGKDFSEYSQHYFRFMSEFGFESFPALKTIQDFTTAADRNILSPVMEDHQRCVGGNAKIIDYMNRYFRFPTNLEQTVYLSWLSQAEAIRHGIQHWRRNRGRCMGSIYWQLNDNWPVASWSSIDSAGRWKALHYEVRRSYAPLLLSSCTPDSIAEAPLPLGNGHFQPQAAVVELHISNESRASVEGKLFWELLNLHGEVITEGQQVFKTSPFTSQNIVRLDFRDQVNGRDVPRTCLVAYRAEFRDGRVLSGFHNFVPYKQLDLIDPQISCLVRSSTLAKDSLILELKSLYPALFVEIDSSEFDLVLSDNFVFLDGIHTTTITVERCTGRDGSVVKVDPEQLQASMILRNLRNSYF